MPIQIDIEDASSDSTVGPAIPAKPTPDAAQIPAASADNPPSKVFIGMVLAAASTPGVETVEEQRAEGGSVTRIVPRIGCLQGEAGRLERVWVQGRVTAVSDRLATLDDGTGSIPVVLTDMEMADPVQTGEGRAAIGVLALIDGVVSVHPDCFGKVRADERAADVLWSAEVVDFLARAQGFSAAAP
eukprot:TRINITY_DN3886_c3_g1_i1.p2 TRINITY_DN3886_c3_g1~~TRINITY_DN3886_c3_g1_i1.p2  ORF type:complete len:186 (+),score=33.59 TRINITY_DN3886_c3_g1_i1:132-689(+)